MADDGFNGATLTLDSVALGPILSITADVVAADVDTTGSGDVAGSSAGGVPTLTTTVEILGGTSVDVGDTGVLAVAWGDIGSSTLGSEATKARCGRVSTSGSKDQPTTTTLEFKKAAPTT